MGRWRSCALLMIAVVGAACGSGEQGAGAPTAGASAETAPLAARRPSARLVLNDFGFSRTMNASGGPLEDPSNPFFQSLGTNGRACSTCHVPEAGMTMTPQVARRRFQESRGTDPLFRAVDGAVSPGADTSSLHARRKAYALLLDRALIRVGIGLPEVREFDLVAVDDPYGFASAKELSLFRRILPSSNLRFLSTVMWDGRETFRDPSSPNGWATLHFDLADQSNGATLGHAQAAAPLDDAQRDAIVDFEMQLYTAQVWDFRSGDLGARGAQGGPEALVSQEFYFGINDALGGDPTGRPFDPTVVTLYDAWASEHPRVHGRDAARAAIARGQELFNHKPLSIVGVAGLNDDLGMDSIPGTCTTCHDTPNAGNHSVPAPLRIGTDLPRPPGGLDVSRLPVYTLRNRLTGEIETTTDPGRALLTGKWKDVGRFKGPILRGLAARPPYFHNGSAATLEDVIRFYDERFAIGLTPREKSDLLAFLAAL